LTGIAEELTPTPTEKPTVSIFFLKIKEQQPPGITQKMINDKLWSFFKCVNLDFAKYY